MAEHGGHACDQRRVFAGPVAQGDDGERAFAGVEQQGEGGDVLAAGPQHVGGADIAGPDRADVAEPGGAGEDEAERDGAEQVAGQEGDETTVIRKALSLRERVG